MLRRELAGLGLWVDSAGQSPPETAAAILAGTAAAAVPAAGS
jgi:hypothetical protein